MKNKRMNAWKRMLFVVICMVVAFALLPGISATAASAEISQITTGSTQDLLIVLLSAFILGSMVLLAVIRMNKRKYY